MISLPCASLRLDRELLIALLLLRRSRHPFLPIRRRNPPILALPPLSSPRPRVNQRALRLRARRLGLRLSLHSSRSLLPFPTCSAACGTPSPPRRPCTATDSHLHLKRSDKATRLRTGAGLRSLGLHHDVHALRGRRGEGHRLRRRRARRFPIAVLRGALG